MIDWLRALWDRPIGDAERMPLFVISATVLVGAALLFAVVGDKDPLPRSASAERAPKEPVAEEPQPAPPPVEEEDDARTPALEAAPEPGELRRAQRVAHRFLAAYLPWSYGRGSLGAIGASASPELRDELEAQPPRVPQGAENAAPRVRSLQAEQATERSMQVLAVVDDGERTYSLALALERVSRTWRVTGLGG